MIKDFSASEYHADKVGAPVATLSSGLLSRILRGNMEHVRLAHPRLNPNWLPEKSDKFSTGTAAHDLILEGGTNKIEVIDPALYPAKNGNIPEGWTNNSIREARDSAYARGQTPILKADYADVESMAQAAFKAIAEEPELKGLKLATHGQAERTVIWQDGETWCRARPDWLDDDKTLMIDLKTTSALSPEQWERGYLSQMGYDLQQEFYCRGVEIVTGTRPRWLWLVQQDFYPFSCWFAEPEQDMREGAKLEVDNAIRRWSECLKANVWPDWPKGIRRVSQTSWKARDSENSAMENDLWDRNATGAREAFLFGRVTGNGKAGTLEEFDK